MTPHAPSSIWSRALRALRRLGPVGFAKLCFFNLRLFISGRYRDHDYAYDRSFDQKYNVDTSGTVAVNELEALADLKRRASRYEPADPEFFNFLVDRLALARRADYLFIDVGSGKGRGMLLAALAGFRRVIGLELDPGLTSVARRNIEIFHGEAPHTDFTVSEGDATEFAFLPVATVIFLNNPFDEQLVAKMLDNIDRAHHGSGLDVALIYMHSNHADLIRARPMWEERERGCFKNSRQFYSIFWRPRSGGRSSSHL